MFSKYANRCTDMYRLVQQCKYLWNVWEECSAVHVNWNNSYRRWFAWGIDWNNLRYSALGNVERISCAFKLIWTIRKVRDWLLNRQTCNHFSLFNDVSHATCFVRRHDSYFVLYISDQFKLFHLNAMLKYLINVFDLYLDRGTVSESECRLVAYSSRLLVASLIQFCSRIIVAIE